LDAAPRAVEVAPAEAEAVKGPLTLLEKRKDVAAHFLPLPDHKKQKTEWAARLRQILSPPDMLNEDGTIKQDYFKPKKVVIQTDRRWGDAEKEKLLEGLEKFGVGGWKDIVAKLLPKWDDNTVRIKTCRVVGSQNLKRYMGWKPTREEVAKEFAKNRALGEKLSCWKAGMLVDNDQGDVAAALKEMEGTKQ